MRSSFNFQTDDSRKVLVDYLTIFAVAAYVKIITITSSAAFPGWLTPPSTESLPTTIAQTSVICIAWTLANLRDNGFAIDTIDTRVAKVGARPAKSSRDKLILAVLNTANTWLFSAVLVALFSSILGDVVNNEDTAKVVAILLPILCLERCVLTIR